MPAQIIVDVVGTAELDGSYTVTWTATGSTDMPTEVFVHKFSTEEFDHVANPGDLIWPTSKDPTKAWYRLTTASANYPDIDTADAAKAEVQADLGSLVDAYEAGLSTFLTPDTLTIDPTP